MKKLIYILSFAFLFLFGSNWAFAAEGQSVGDKNAQSEQVSSSQPTKNAADANTHKLSLKEKIKIKLLQKALDIFDNKGTTGDAEMLLYVILAFILPPLAVGLKTSWNKFKVLLDLIFWLSGFILGMWFLGYIPAIIYALLVVFDIL